MSNPMEAKGFNPLSAVGNNPSSMTGIPYAPSSYDWEEEDLSDKDAGRTEDGNMWKNYIGTIRGIKVKWNGLKSDEASDILELFSTEYVYVRFFDLRHCQYEESWFYVGNRTASLYNGVVNRWSEISFDLIERTPVTI